MASTTITVDGRVRSDAIVVGAGPAGLAVAACLINDELSAALVIPITVASLLGQLDVGASGRAAIGLVIINLSGGILASVAYGLLTLRPSLFSIFLIVLAVAEGRARA